MKNFLMFFAFFAMTAVFVACDDDDDPIDDNTIVDVAQDTESLSTLVSALESADLVENLNGDGPYTVFAPTNDAFQALLDSNDDWNSLSDIPSDVLDLVLKYHVLNGEVESTDLSDTYVNTLASAQGESISLPVRTTGGVLLDGDTEPVQVDVEADNGVVHIVNKVMQPNDIVQFAMDNPDFSILVEALTDSRHTTDYVSTLTGDGPFTVFAPTNDAFQALLDSNDDWNGLGDIPIGTLEAVLNYHVVSGANVQSDQLSDDMTVTTLGGDLTVDLSDGAALETTSGQNVSITITDVQGTNGVIHAINSVLLP